LPAVIDLVAFDGDDTLWHNESVFSITQAQFGQLMAPYGDGAALESRLFATQMRNLGLFGYGVKSFTLSMIETAIELTDGAVAARDIQAIIDAGRAMLEHPVELLDGAVEAIERVAAEHRVILVTKGDLFDQESKLARSGLGDRFAAVDVVSEKDEATYRRVLARHGVAPERFVMVGNSGRSDVLPVLGIGGWSVHVPYPITWAHEHVEEAALVPRDRYHRIASLAELPAVLAAVAAA
jgi:putative hydrolase of the HAD superfamily